MKRSNAEAWLVIPAVLAVAAWLVLTRTLEHRQFRAECAGLGIERMVERPSDDDLRRMVDDCARGRRSP